MEARDLHTHNIQRKYNDRKKGKIIRIMLNETYQEISFPIMSTPGSSHRKVIFRLTRSIHIPSKACSDEEYVSKEFVSSH